MIYKVTITDSVTYYIDSDKDHYAKDDADQAESLALEWWAERDPQVAIEKVAPCQINGKCPFDLSKHTCSDCMKGEI